MINDKKLIQTLYFIKDILSRILEFYIFITIVTVSVLLFLIAVYGGSIVITINWENHQELVKSLLSHIKSLK